MRKFEVDLFQEVHETKVLYPWSYSPEDPPRSCFIYQYFPVLYAVLRPNFYLIFFLEVSEALQMKESQISWILNTSCAKRVLAVILKGICEPLRTASRDILEALEIYSTPGNPFFKRSDRLTFSLGGPLQSLPRVPEEYSGVYLLIHFKFC